MKDLKRARVFFLCFFTLWRPVLSPLLSVPLAPAPSASQFSPRHPPHALFTMVQKTKGKHRLDKFYHLAKEQG